MTKYTLGIMFSEDLKKVLLILKNRPAWQKGFYNFPGGHVENNENSFICVSREFKEECNLTIKTSDWKQIGEIVGSDYSVKILTTLYLEQFGELKAMEDQSVQCFDCDNLPKNILPNLSWLVPFAKNIWTQGHPDKLLFGTFDYIK
jgi:ADP-ribose pyrophosphatase YjhB (NUDIX family)